MDRTRHFAQLTILVSHSPQYFLDIYFWSCCEALQQVVLGKEGDSHLYKFTRITFIAILLCSWWHNVTNYTQRHEETVRKTKMKPTGVVCRWKDSSRLLNVSAVSSFRWIKGSPVSCDQNPPFSTVMTKTLVVRAKYSPLFLLFAKHCYSYCTHVHTP